MKKILLSFLILSAIFSCSKTTDSARPNDVDEIAFSYQKLTLLPNLITQQLAFDMKTPIEKQNLWKQKYKEMLQQKDLSFEQKKFINSVINVLNPQIFDNKSKEAKIFQINTLDKLVIEAEKYFTKQQVFNLFFDLNNTKVEKGNENVTFKLVDDEGKVCMCAIGSKYTCARLKLIIGYPPAFETEYGTCSDNNCVVTYSGCGGMWASSCDGIKCTY